jgi:glycosyltransferase involved in cell wall biosynthesis
MKGEIKVVANGFDTGFWLKESTQQKKNIVMTVASINNLRNYYLKGIDSFIELAGLLTEYEFLLVGMTREFLRKQSGIINLPANLNVIEFVQPQKLREYYRQAKIFCLFSLTEGMSNVLCEAMLCECIPVGSNVTFIPQIIGPNGFIIYRKDINEMKHTVLKALNSNISLGKKAKQWIIDNFSLEKREKALTEVVREQLKK